MALGRVYWITGLAGAGKTTIGNALYYELKEKHSKVVILDGDILKSIVGEMGYSFKERLERAHRYARLCKVLSDQGVTVIICTIAMFDSVREWNRENINGYIEVYLEVDIKVLVERDRKGLYSKHKKGEVVDVAGVDTEVELPKSPDLTITNDGRYTVMQCVSMILSLDEKDRDHFNRDTEYWNAYYKENPPKRNNASRFALEVLKYVEPNKSLLDIGCGNGRDSLFFMEKGIEVVGIDASPEVIKALNCKYKDNLGIFVCDDFVRANAIYQRQYDYCYSRFTLHAISEKQQIELFDNIKDALKPNGKIFIEARSINDDLYGKGKKVGKHSYYYNGHFRRFIDQKELKKHLESIDVRILYIQEGRGFAPTNDSDPVLIRVVGIKE